MSDENQRPQDGGAPDPWGAPGPGQARGRERENAPLPMRIAMGVGGVALVSALGFGIYSLMSKSESGPKKQVVQISLVAPPPPPPPPPPPEVKPPEPEVEPEQVEAPEPEPEQQADEAPPPGEDLALDAEGSGDGDGFGLAAKKGGTDITTIGGGAGGDRSRFTWFTGQVQTQLQDYLQRDDKLRRSDYRVVLRLWFSDDGRIERYELVSGSGNAELDRNLKLAMDQAPRLRQAPPDDLPQPLKLRVTSRGAG